MDWNALAQRLDAETARRFAQAARHVIDVLLIETATAVRRQTPREIDYTQATLRRDTPPGGWLTHAELRREAQLMQEALAAERWLDGALAALRIFNGLGR